MLHGITLDNQVPALHSATASNNYETHFPNYWNYNIAYLFTGTLLHTLYIFLTSYILGRKLHSISNPLNMRIGMK